MIYWSYVKKPKVDPSEIAPIKKKSKDSGKGAEVNYESYKKFFIPFVKFISKKVSPFWMRSEYGAHALDRFAECQNNCQIIKTPKGGCGGNHKSNTGYCFYLIEDIGDKNGGE